MIFSYPKVTLEWKGWLTRRWAECWLMNEWMNERGCNRKSFFFQCYFITLFIWWQFEGPPEGAIDLHSCLLGKLSSTEVNILKQWHGYCLFHQLWVETHLSSRFMLTLALWTLISHLTFTAVHHIHKVMAQNTFVWDHQYSHLCLTWGYLSCGSKAFRLAG